eukprot:gene12166-5656_t
MSDELVDKFNKWMPDVVKNGLPEEIKKVQDEISDTLEKAVKDLDFKEIYRINGTLSTCLRLKYPFTKELKEKIVSLLYTAFVNPQLDPKGHHKLSITIDGLIGKKDELDISLEWKPLFDVFKKYHFTKSRSLNFKLGREHSDYLLNVLKKVRKFFSKDATEEIFDYVRPLLCPHDNSMYIAQALLCQFLPTNKKNLKWLDEFMAIWSLNDHCAPWDYHMLSLLSRFAEDNIDENVDWKLYEEEIFTRILFSFELPVGPQTPKYYTSFPSSSMTLIQSNDQLISKIMVCSSRLIIWMLDEKKNNVFKLLKKLIHSIEIYFQPSNTGQWSGNIGRWLVVLCSEFANRIKKEKQNDRGFKDISSKFVDLIFPIAELALYSKSPIVGYFACQAIKHLSFVEPEKFYVTQMQNVYYAFQTLTETHRTRAAFELATVTVHPFLKYIKEKDFVGNVLELSLDGIDANDAIKTYQALTLYSRIFDTIPIFEGGKSSIGDETMPELSYMFSDWIYKFLEKFFICLEKQSAPEKKRGQFDTSLSPAVLEGVLNIFFSQLSEKIHRDISKRIIGFLTENFLPDAKKQIGVFCTSASTSSEFVETIFLKLYNKVVNNGELEHLTSSEISYYLYLMGRTLRGIGAHKAIPKLKKEIFHLLKLTWLSTDKNTLKNSGKLIRALSRSLGNIYPLDYKSVPEDEWNDKKFQEEHWTTWGKTYTVDNINMKWHIPSDDELNLLSEIYDTFVDGPFTDLKDCKQFKEVESNALLKLRYIIRAYATLLPIIEGDDKTYTKKKYFNPGNSVLKSKLKYSRSDIAALLHDLVISSSEILDPKFTNLLIKNISCLISKPNSKKTSETPSNYSNYKRQIFNSNHERSYPRFYLVSFVNELFQRRLSSFHQVYTPFHEDLLKDLKKLSLSSFSANRKKAQKAFVSALKPFKEKLIKSHMPELLEILRSKKVEKEKITGAMYLLLNKSCIKSITSNWDLMIDFVKSLLQCTEIEEESDQKRLNTLFSTYTTTFQELSFKKEKYQEVLQELVKTINEKQHWKTQLMNLTFLSLYIRSDYTSFYPIEVIKIFIESSLSDVEAIRISSIKTLDLIFTQYKPIQPKKKISFDKQYRSFDDASNIEQPKNEKEWNDTIFFDKNYFGYYSYPKEAEVYDYKKKNEFKDKYYEERQLFLKEIGPLLNEKWIEKLVFYLSLQSQNPLSMQGSGYSFGFSQFFKGLFQLFGIQMFKKVHPFLEKLLSNAGSGTPEEEHQIHLGLEIIAGLSRGMKHWKFDDREEIISHLKVLLKKLFENCSITTLNNIQSCFRFCAFDTDVRRIKWLLDLTLENVDLESGTSSNQAKRLKLLSPILSEISWRDRNSHIKLINVLVKHLDHSFQQVREFISDSLSLFMRFYSYVPRDEKTLLLTYNAKEKKEDHNQMIIDSIKKKYEELEDKKNITKTILSWSARISRYESFYTSVYIKDIIPIVISVYDDTSSDPELQAKSRDLFISISSSLFKKNISIEIMKLIQFLNSHESWRVRYAILIFLQIFGYHHEFYLNSSDILNFLSSLLIDKSIEVRNLSSKTLGGFIKSTNDTQKILDLVDKYLKIKPKKPKTDTEILECHSNVLGLSSIISAYPYSIPDFLPKVIVKLTSYANYRVPISTTAKQTFADFWKTHQDNWNYGFKEKFTDDELYAISQLKGSNQYFV